MLISEEFSWSSFNYKSEEYQSVKNINLHADGSMLEVVKSLMPCLAFSLINYSRSARRKKVKCIASTMFDLEAGCLSLLVLE